MTCKRMFSSLKPGQKELVLLIQRLRFGSLKEIRVVKGDPQVKSVIATQFINFPHDSTKVIQDSGDFELKLEMAQMIETIEKERLGRIDLIQVRHGLPFRIEVSSLVA